MIGPFTDKRSCRRKITQPWLRYAASGEEIGGFRACTGGRDTPISELRITGWFSRWDWPTPEFRPRKSGRVVRLYSNMSNYDVITAIDNAYGLRAVVHRGMRPPRCYRLNITHRYRLLQPEFSLQGRFDGAKTKCGLDIASSVVIGVCASS